jgi:hypothetical protein
MRDKYFTPKGMPKFGNPIAEYSKRKLAMQNEGQTAPEANRRKSIWVPLKMMQTIKMDKNLKRMQTKLPENEYSKPKKMEGIEVPEAEKDIDSDNSSLKSDSSLEDSSDDNNTAGKKSSNFASTKEKVARAKMIRRDSIKKSERIGQIVQQSMLEKIQQQNAL